jgi:hypothetical protein
MIDETSTLPVAVDPGFNQSLPLPRRLVEGLCKGHCTLYVVIGLIKLIKATVRIR